MKKINAKRYQSRRRVSAGSGSVVNGQRLFQWTSDNTTRIVLEGKIEADNILSI